MTLKDKIMPVCWTVFPSLGCCWKVIEYSGVWVCWKEVKGGTETLASAGCSLASWGAPSCLTQAQSVRAYLGWSETSEAVSQNKTSSFSVDCFWVFVERKLTNTDGKMWNYLRIRKIAGDSQKLISRNRKLKK